MTKDIFKLYCTFWGLTFVDTLDSGEWPETAAVGFVDDPSYGAAAVQLTNTGEFFVVTGWADPDEGRLEDVWRLVRAEEVNAVDLPHHRFHAVE